MLIEICVGSSCHLKGSAKLVELFKSSVAEHGLSDEVALAGSFCVGQCNRNGVTVIIDGNIHTGVTPESFAGFFEENVLNIINKQRM